MDTDIETRRTMSQDLIIMEAIIQDTTWMDIILIMEDLNTEMTMNITKTNIMEGQDNLYCHHQIVITTDQDHSMNLTEQED